MTILRKICNGAEGSMWAKMHAADKISFLVFCVFALGMSVALGDAADRFAAREHAYQCRQDGQDDVVSIQLNVEFNCY